MLRPVSLLAALLLTAAGISAAPALADAQDPAPSLHRADPDPVTQPYGAYLVGREALGQGDDRRAAAVLEALADAYPDEPRLRRQGFTAALLTGDIAGAARLAPRTEAADDDGLESLGRLVRATEALHAQHAAEAAALLDPARMSLPYRTAGYMLRPWALAAAGDWTSALAEPDLGPDRYADLEVRLSQARLFEIQGRLPDAESRYKALLAGDRTRDVARLPYGEFLERRGRGGEALALYDAGLVGEPNNAALTEARARVARKGRPPAVGGLAEGAAQALTFAGWASAARQGGLSVVYTRLALRLDPTLDEAWMVLGEEMERARHPEDARAAWSQVRPSSRYWAMARADLAESLASSGDVKGAVKLARGTADSLPGDLKSQMTLADLLATTDQPKAALSVLDHALRVGGSQDWRVRYMRASTYDKLGRWKDAEPELKQALKLAPDSADVENYLGYSWIDHGDHVKEGLALVEKAAAAQPNSGAYQDSVGWAHFKLGDYGVAVEQLEKAVELEPADADINDHLGDAYWMVGRKTEAGYQWKRVLELEPAPALKASIERKLRDGLVARVATR